MSEKTLRSDYEGRPLEELHEAAQKIISPYTYEAPVGADGVRSKGVVRLGKGEIMKGQVQIVRKDGGENNLHYHTHTETYWMVLKGRAKFYGPNDELIGDYGQFEGLVTPRYCRYWFENATPDGSNLELLQIAASDSPGHINGRTDAVARKEGWIRGIDMKTGAPVGDHYEK